MNFSNSYFFAFILATAFHALVVAALMMHWQNKSGIEVTQIKPYYIEASLVPENPNEAKKAKAEEMKRKREAEARAERERQAQLRKKREEAKKKAEEKPAVKKDEADEVKVVDIPPLKDVDSENEQAKADRAERKEMENNLAREIAKEQEARRAITDDEKAMAYVAQIQRDIIQNWSRPPSARNGMEALLRVRLVPTGEVVDVSVEKSSGNDAFDRSAVLAVEKADRFQVPRDSRLFEEKFREFTVLFRPEDLRL